MRRAWLALFSIALTWGFAAADQVPRQESLQKQPRTGALQKISNPLNDLLNEARSALDRKDYEAAIAPLKKVLAEEPGSAYAHFQLGYAYAGLKRFEDARDEYRRAAELDPDLAEAHLNLGLLLLDRDPSAAVAPLRKAVELLPAQSRPHYLLGRALEGSGDLAGATAALRGAEQLDPRHVDTLVALARVLLMDNHASEAEGKYQAALAIQPDSAPACLGLAHSLEAQQKPQAVDAFRKYLAMQPDDRVARWRTARLLFDAKQYDAALAELDTLDAAGAQIDSLRLRADIQTALLHWDDVIAALKRAAELSPRDARLRAGIGQGFLEKRDFVAAETELKAALRLDGNYLPAWQNLSTALYLAGNCTAALAAFDEVARRTTPTEGVWFARATCYDKMNRRPEALDAYKIFLQLDKNRHENQCWQAEQRIKTLQRILGGKH